MELEVGVSIRNKASTWVIRSLSRPASVEIQSKASAIFSNLVPQAICPARR